MNRIAISPAAELVARALLHMDSPDAVRSCKDEDFAVPHSKFKTDTIRHAFIELESKGALSRGRRSRRDGSRQVELHLDHWVWDAARSNTKAGA